MVLGTIAAPQWILIAKFPNWQNSTRQVKDFGFDLVLPIPVQPKSPLKVRKSGRAQKAPELGGGPQKSTRRTPTPIKAPAAQDRQGHRDGVPRTVVEIEGEEDVLSLDPTRSRGNSASVNKRKHEEGTNLEEPATKKKRKATPKHGSQIPKPAASKTTERIPNNVGDAFRDIGTKDDAIRDVETKESTTKRKRKVMPLRRLRETKSSITASIDRIPELEEGTSLKKGITEDGRMEDICLPEISGTLQNQEATGAKAIDKEVSRPGRTKGEIGRSNIKAKKKPSQRKQDHDANAHQEDMDKESLGQQIPTAEQAAPAVAPTRKRKKRKSIGQQTTKRAKKVVPNAPQRTTDSRTLHETSDLVHELLDDTIEVAPENLEIEEPQTAESFNRVSTEQPENGSQHAAPSAPGKASRQNLRSVNDFDTTLNPPTKKSEQLNKPKPKKKRRSITQARKPKPKKVTQNDAQEDSPEATDSAPKPTAVSPSPATSVPSSRVSGRKPLSNITNLTPDLAIAETITAPAEEKIQPLAPPKKRGRPPKNPITDTGNTSTSGNDIEKPAPVSELLAASSTRPSVAPKKTAKASAKPRGILKAFKEPISTVFEAPVRSQIYDLHSDSDDPLSGASAVRLKKNFKAAKIVARDSNELRERHITRSEANVHVPHSIPKLSTTMRGERISNELAKTTHRAKHVSTPQKKSIEVEKRKEAEQKEIEGLLSSIGKAVKRGRALAAVEA